MVDRLVNCWQAFWCMYILSASFISNFEIIRHHHQYDVLKQLVINAIASLGVAMFAERYLSITTIEHKFGWYQVVVSLLIMEIWFYYSHRIAHSKYIFPRIHRMHHFFTQPYAFTGVYCSVGEMLFINIPSMMIGPIITGMSYNLMTTWIVIIAINTAISHSDVIIPYINSGTHGIHHQKHNKNFGILGILDRIHGTYESM